MKAKGIFLMILFLLSSILTVSGKVDLVYGSYEIVPGLILSADKEYYYIEYNIPKCQEVVEETEWGNFSKIEFMDDDKFFFMDSVGMPELPIKSLCLQLPLDVANVDAKIDYECYDVDYEEIELSYPYLPYQEYARANDDGVFQISNDFYGSDTWCGSVDGGVDVSDVYSIFGCKGVTINMYPVKYNPKGNIVRIPKKIRLKISVSLGKIVSAQTALRRFQTEFFDSYYFFDITDDDPSFKGRLAIYTIPEFEPSLKTFVNYKTECGYDVDVYSSSDFRYDRELRGAIMSAYMGIRRPDFVLIVGHPLIIPYSKGNPNDFKNPETDIYYACLERSDLAKEPLTPDLFIGRWPVYKSDQITRLTRKVMEFERVAGNMKRDDYEVDLFSGTGSCEKNFAKDIIALAKRIDNSGYKTKLFDGRIFNSDSEALDCMLGELNRDLWMYIYSGHGSDLGVGSPYNLTYKYFGQLNVRAMNPMAFIFACSTNARPYNSAENFCQSVLCANQGFVSCLGATCSTYVMPDRNLGKSIFSQFERGNVHVGEIIYHGMSRYRNVYAKVQKTRRQVEKYVFLGDPTMYINGLDDMKNPIEKNVLKENVEENKIEPEKCEITIFPTIVDTEVIVSSTSSIISLVLVDLSGTVVLTKNDCVESEVVLDLSSLSDGIYIVKIVTLLGENYVAKLMVKH